MKPFYAFSETPKRPFRSILEDLPDYMPSVHGNEKVHISRRNCSGVTKEVKQQEVKQTFAPTANKTTVSLSPNRRIESKSNVIKGSEYSGAWSEAVWIAILVLVCYSNATLCEFTFDDVSAIKQNQDLRPETPLSTLFQNDFWGQPMAKDYSHKSYRPLTVLTFRANFMISGLAPFSYHVVNVVLHLIVCLLFKRFANTIASGRLAFVATVLFAVHPVHTEAVASAVGRAETLSASFFLAALIYYSRVTCTKCTWNKSWNDLILLTLSVLGATFSKEQGITVLAVCGVFEIAFNQKIIVPSQWRQLMERRIAVLRIGFLAALGAIILTIRLTVQRGELPVFTRFDNPAAMEATPVRQMTQNYLVALNAWLLLFPSALCADWTMGSVPLLLSHTDLRNVATLAFYTLFILIAAKAVFQNDRVILLALALVVFPFLPASNLFFPVGFVVAERVLYTPSLGFALIVASGVITLEESLNSKNLRTIFKFFLILLVVSHSAKAILRNMDWYSERDLFTSGIRVNPKNAKLYNNIGHTYEAENKPEVALQYYLHALDIQPDDLGAHMNVGRMLAAMNRPKEAENYFRSAERLIPRAEDGSNRARIAPDHLMLFLHWARLVSKDSKRLEEASSLFERVTKMRPEFVDAWVNWGEVLLAQNRTGRAEKVYRRALKLDPNNADVHYNLGVVAIQSGNLDAAIGHFERTLQLSPKHLQALLNYGIVVQDANRRELFPRAKLQLMRLIDIESSNERAHFHLGMLHMTLGEQNEARASFEVAVKLQPDFRSATFNLALLLTNKNLNDEALPHLKTLIRYHPDHVKGLTLLGDILINHKKDYDGAQDSYRRILRLDPRNIQAQHNLCVVFIEKGRLKDAESCLEQASRIAPNEQYLTKHLKILRARLTQIRSKQS